MVDYKFHSVLTLNFAIIFQMKKNNWCQWFLFCWTVNICITKLMLNIIFHNKTNLAWVKRPTYTTDSGTNSHKLELSEKRSKALHFTVTL